MAHGEKPWVNAEPVGRHRIEETLCRPSRGFFECETIIPALFALGHIMAALTGLAGADTARYRICETRYLAIHLFVLFDEGIASRSMILSHFLFIKGWKGTSKGL